MEDVYDAPNAIWELASAMHHTTHSIPTMAEIIESCADAVDNMSREQLPSTARHEQHLIHDPVLPEGD
eukprot:451361-Karenia_brevis.AAC.1